MIEEQFEVQEEWEELKFREAWDNKERRMSCLGVCAAACMVAIQCALGITFAVVVA